MEQLTYPLSLQNIFIILSFCAQLLLSDCPSLCECKWKSGKESVICLNANLSSVPLHLDAGTQLLDLTSNNLNTVRQDEFSKAGLLNLQKIYISKCRLKSLDRYAFRHLINLVQLDLSYNSLVSVPSHVFESIPELRELELSGNPIQKIMNDAFANVPKLVKLEISDCKVSVVETYSFRGLEKSLEWLKLDKNNLVEVKSMAFTILKNLHGLEIANNPWNCSCKLRPLREWMLRKNVPFGIPPACRFPNRLANKSWDKLELDEFACIPEILALDPKARGVEGKNVTMTCHITGIPEPNVRWMLKNKVIGNLSGTTYANGKKVYVVQLQNNSSDLTILTADVQDAGVYTCTAENKAGRAEASVTLAVSRKPPDSTLSKKVLLASVLAGLFFVLISCSVTLCLFTVRRKYVTRWQRRNRRREDNYEKIEMNHKVVKTLSNKSEPVEDEVRKNGEYRLVPGAEAEQDVDKDEEAFETPAVAGVIAASANTHKDAVKTWSNENSNEKWNSPELSLLDSEDLHIPRRTIKETRDDRRKNSPLTSGTYNKQDYLFDSPNNNTQPIFQMPVANSCLLDNAAYDSSTSADFSSSFIEEDADKKYPDLIEGSSSAYKGSLKAISEGNSLSDISELYCTLPRKNLLKQYHKDQLKYCSTDSQFPLLQDSRYSSSGEDSTAELPFPSSKRKLSEGHKYMYTNLVNRTNSKKSSSSLNLTSSKQNLSIPSSPMREEVSRNVATPLLDINSLDNRVSYRRHVVSSSPAPSPIQTTTAAIANSYDYHAAQLERFLEEYRNLQKELTKMKETCENLNREKSPSQYVDPLMGNSCSPLSPSDSTASKVSSNTPSSIMPNSPNSNQTLDSSISNFGNELSRYLITSRNTTSPKNFNSGGGVFN